MLRSVFNALVATTLLAACGARTTVEVVKAPRFSAAAEVENIGVMPFSGQRGAEIAELFANKLRTSRAQDLPVFNVSFSRKRTGDAVYTGTVEVHEASSRNYSETYRTCSRKKNPKKFFSKCVAWSERTERCTEITATVRVAIQLTMRRSGKTIYSEVHDSDRSEAECGNRRGKTSRQALLREALDDVVTEFYQDVAPHVVEESVAIKRSFRGDGADPASEERFAGAAEFLTAGDREQACRMWGDLMDSGITDPNLLYNVAFCEEATGDVQYALRLLQEAKSGLTRPDSDFVEAEKRLRSQGATY